MPNAPAHRLVSLLSAARTLPEAALTAVVAQPQAVAPAIIAVVEKAADGVYLMPDQQRLLYWGLPALAAAGHRPLCGPLLRLLRRPRSELDELLGLQVDELLAGLLLACWNGDAAALFALAGDRSVDGSVRWTVLCAMARLVHDSRIARDDMVAFLHRFYSEPLADMGDAAWEGWQDAILLLGIDALRGAVEASWESGLNPQAAPDRAEWQADYVAACATFDRTALFEADGIVALGNAVGALRRIERLTAPAVVRRPKHPVQRKWERRDPARSVRLDDEEQDWLAGFLSSAQVPEGAMSLEELDGFFTALVAGPELVPPSLFLPLVWGEGEGDEIVFDSEEQARFVMELVMRHWDTIARWLDADFPHIPLLYEWTDVPKASRWAQGFGRGVGLGGDAWDLLAEDEEMGPAFLGPIVMLDAAGRDPGVAPPGAEQRQKFVETLPLTILGIHRFWREGAAADEPVRVKKVSRNEPCPCGSGRKYKHCCGSGSGRPPSIH